MLYRAVELGASVVLKTAQADAIHEDIIKTRDGEVVISRHASEAVIKGLSRSASGSESWSHALAGTRQPLSRSGRVAGDPPPPRRALDPGLGSSPPGLFRLLRVDVPVGSQQFAQQLSEDR